MKDQKIILWTATKEEKVNNIYIPYLKENFINVDYLNCNPDCISNDYTCFDKKFYYDIMIDDKAGFEIIQWVDIYNEILKWR